MVFTTSKTVMPCDAIAAGCTALEGTRVSPLAQDCVYSCVSLHISFTINSHRHIRLACVCRTRARKASRLYLGGLSRWPLVPGALFSGVFAPPGVACGACRKAGGAGNVGRACEGALMSADTAVPPAPCCCGVCGVCRVWVVRGVCAVGLNGVAGTTLCCPALADMAGVLVGMCASLPLPLPLLPDDASPHGAVPEAKFGAALLFCVAGTAPRIVACGPTASVAHAVSALGDCMLLNSCDRSRTPDVFAGVPVACWENACECACAMACACAGVCGAPSGCCSLM